MKIPTDSEAREFIEKSGFTWHQSFPLSGNVYTPGANDVEWILDRSQVPRRLEGLSVIDVGTSNGAISFLLERRGADRVVAADIVPPHHFGFTDISTFLESKVEFVQSSIYDLPSVLDERFDLIVCWGVLYHLRYPLLALDALRNLCQEESDGPGSLLSLESAVADSSLPVADRQEPILRFVGGGRLGGDESNWFAPTTTALVELVRSADFEPENLECWPSAVAERAVVLARAAEGAVSRIAVPGVGEVVRKEAVKSSDHRLARGDEREVRRLEKALAGRERELGAVQDLVATLQREREALRQVVRARDGETAALRSEVDHSSRSRTGVEMIQRVLDAREEELESVKEILAARDEELASIKPVLQAREEESASASYLLSARERELATVKYALRDRERRITDIKSTIRSLSAKLQKLEAERAAPRRSLVEKIYSLLRNKSSMRRGDGSATSHGDGDR